MDMTERLTAYLAGEGKVDEVRTISAGWETEVYAFDLDGAPKVLRVYQGQHVETRARTEFLMMRAMGRMGYPVPHVDRFEADPSTFGGPFLLMERVEGKPLAHFFRERPAAELVQQLVRLMVDLHRRDWRPLVGPEGIWPDLATASGTWGVALLRELADEPVQPLLDWVEQQGQGVDFRPGLIHGDLHFENVLLRPDGSPAVIDWGATGLTDPRCDLAYVYVLMTTEGHEEIGEAIRRAYEAEAGPQTDFEYFITWALIRRLLVMLAVLSRGSAAVGLRPGLEGFLRQRSAYPRKLAALVAERTGLRLPGVEAILAD